MNLPHLKELEVSNYKKFDHIHVKDLGKINLITGDNNVGKTTLLECFLINEDLLWYVNFIHQGLCNREIHSHAKSKTSESRNIIDNYFEEYIIKNIGEPLVFKLKYTDLIEEIIAISSKRYRDLEPEEKAEEVRHDFRLSEEIPYYFIQKINGVLTEIQPFYLDDYERSFNSKLHYRPSIESTLTYASDLERFYESVETNQELNRKFSGLNPANNDFLEKIQLFSSDIEKIEIRAFGNKNLISVLINGENQFKSITQFGTGFIRYFRIVLELFNIQSHENIQRFTIDEIENGIHFTKMKIVWRAIFRLVQQTNVQLFITTHSQECLEMFAEVAQEAEFIDLRDEVRHIEVEELEDNGKMKHYASVYNLDLLISNFNSEVNVRGGSLWKN